MFRVEILYVYLFFFYSADPEEEVGAGEGGGGGGLQPEGARASRPAVRGYGRPGRCLRPLPAVTCKYYHLFLE
jgi:hypothetical protein